MIRRYYGHMLMIALVGAAMFVVALVGLVLDYDPVGPPVGRLDFSCQRARPTDAVIRCSTGGTRIDRDVASLTEEERAYLTRIEDFRRKRDALEIEFLGEGFRAEEREPEIVVPGAGPVVTKALPLGPVLPAIVGGVLVLGLAVAARWAFVAGSEEAEAADPDENEQGTAAPPSGG